MTNMPPLYFVECDFGKLGHAFIECDRDENSRRQIIDDIKSGEISRPIRVLEIFEDENSCRDVTSDIAWSVCHELTRDAEGLPSHLVDFIERECGMRAANSFRVSESV